MSKSTEITSLSYEQAFEELQALINTLESGEKSLDETLKLYQRGQALYQHCQKLLEEAELKIETLDIPE
ncbi:MAG: exodeoxyribonuclease VII small subunit [Anaerolineales bacterium]|nr:exodeoxyribonuclease VII small subunit [Anaerolineales bacterium]